MKFSRMFIRILLENKTIINIDILDGQLPQDQLKLLQIVYYVQWKLSKLECKHQSQVHSQQAELQLLIKLRLMKVFILIQFFRS